MTIQQLHDGGPDGVQLGKGGTAVVIGGTDTDNAAGGTSVNTISMGRTTTDKLGFYGLTTPIVQPAHTDQGAITAGATTTACNNLVIQLRLALVNLGIIKGSN